MQNESGLIQGSSYDYTFQINKQNFVNHQSGRKRLIVTIVTINNKTGITDA